MCFYNQTTKNYCISYENDSYVSSSTGKKVFCTCARVWNNSTGEIIVDVQDCIEYTTIEEFKTALNSYIPDGLPVYDYKGLAMLIKLIKIMIKVEEN